MSFCYPWENDFQTFRATTLLWSQIIVANYYFFQGLWGLRSGNVGSNKYIKKHNATLGTVEPQAFRKHLLVHWLMLDIQLLLSIPPVHGTGFDMSQKSWVKSSQFLKQNLAGQTILTTLYCISVLGQTIQQNSFQRDWTNNLSSWMWLSGIKQGLRPLSV